MSLDREKIVLNTKKYFETGKKYGFITDELVTFLGEPFISAPAFSNTSMPNSFEGGLIDFSLNVTKNLVKLNNLLSDSKKINELSLIKVGLLHQIGKTNLFKPNTSEWHIKNKGELFCFNNELISMRVGQRSLFYAMSNGVTLSEEEAQAILFYDVDDNEDKMSKYYSGSLCKLLKMAIELTLIEKKNV